MLLSTCLCLLLILSSCQTHKKEKKYYTLLLDWWANPNHIPLFVGIHEGIFEKEGIPLSIIDSQEPPSGLQYLINGQIDLSLYYLPSSLYKYSQKPLFKAIGVLIDVPLYSLMAKKDTVSSPFQGCINNPIGCYGDKLSKRCFQDLEARGISFCEIKTVQFDLNTLFYTDLLDLTLGGYWNVEPYQLLEKNIDIEVMTWETLGFPWYPELLVFANEELLKKDPSFALKFQKALQLSIDLCRKDPENAFQIYLSNHPEKIHGASWEKQAWQATLATFAKEQSLNKKKLSFFIEWLFGNSLDLHTQSIVDPIRDSE